jgi:hypothetical protein
MAIYRMTEAEKTKLENIAPASSSVLGLVRLNYTEDGNNKKVRIDVNNDVYVTVPNVTTSTQGLLTAADKIKLDTFTTGVNWALFAGSQVINKASYYAFATNMSKLRMAHLEIDITGVGTWLVFIPASGEVSVEWEGLTLELESTTAGLTVIYTAGEPASITITEIRFYPFGSQ